MLSSVLLVHPRHIERNFYKICVFCHFFLIPILGIWFLVCSAEVAWCAILMLAKVFGPCVLVLAKAYSGAKRTAADPFAPFREVAYTNICTQALRINVIVRMTSYRGYTYTYHMLYSTSLSGRYKTARHIYRTYPIAYTS